MTGVTGSSRVGPVELGTVELGTVDVRLATFLQAAVLARMNIMVTGAANAGTTTLLRALIDLISRDG